jgi:pyruvate/2-oxoglutarate dehydrogenase complex dihydrolipoamide acyltransferase (E2) component
MAMSEAVLLAWLKEPGDAVEAGEVIAEVETDKSVLEISASAAGRLGAHRVAAGESVAVGATVTVVLADGESEPAAEHDTDPENSEERSGVSRGRSTGTARGVRPRDRSPGRPPGASAPARLAPGELTAPGRGRISRPAAEWVPGTPSPRQVSIWSGSRISRSPAKSFADSVTDRLLARCLPRGQVTVRIFSSGAWAKSGPIRS